MNTGGLFNIFATESHPAFGGVTFPEEISDEVREVMVERARGDTNIFLLAIVAFLETHPEHEQESYIVNRGDRNLLIFEKLVANLSHGEADELMAKYWDFKKRNIEMMIDVFANPEKDEYQIQQGDESVSLLEKWKQHLNRK